MINQAYRRDPYRRNAEAGCGVRINDHLKQEMRQRRFPFPDNI